MAFTLRVETADGPVYDTNGNRVGTWEITGEEQ